MFANPGAASKPESQRAKRHCFSFHSRWSRKNHSPSKKYGVFAQKTTLLEEKKSRWSRKEGGCQTMALILCRVNGRMMDFFPKKHFLEKKLQVDTQQSFVQKYRLFVHFLLKEKRCFQYNFRLYYNQDNSFKTLWHSIICLVHPSILP